jgi:hypothetical protein
MANSTATRPKVDYN